MKNIFFCYFLIVGFNIFAQQRNNNAVNPFYVPGKTVTQEQFYSFFMSEFSLNKNNTFELKTSHNADHQKYQQYYQGLLVKNGISILHLKNGMVEKSSGNIYDVSMTNIQPNLSENKARELSKNLFYKFNKRNKISDLNISLKLVICNEKYPEDNGSFVPTYEVIVESSSQHLKEQFLINGLTGNLIFKQNLIHSHSVPGKGRTYHYGEKSFLVDSINPTTFNLYDKDRNITSQFGNETATYVASDTDNYWEFEHKDASVIDAHYCTSKFHDMMKTKFNYVGIDGNNGAMNPIILSEKGLVNAFWTGEYAIFGRGDCHYSPLTTLSIVGHEFTHGVTEYNSNLIYNGESGAMNEAFSDVFGKALEKFEDPTNFNWLIDGKIAEDSEAEAFRSMEDPKAYDCPAMYKGEMWVDNADVHTNSSILNHWFYLMIDGKTGTNEKGENYNVSPQPIQDVLDILFLCQTSYLTESSNYNDLYIFTKEVCKNKFGENSAIYSSLIEAWKAVGLPYENSGNNLDFDLEIAGLQDLDEKICSTVGEEIDISVNIVNHGKRIAAGTILNIFVDDNNYEVTLENELQQGETTSIVLEGAYIVIDYGFQFLSLRIENNDEVLDNNYSYSYFYALSIEPDLAISYPSFEIGDCKSIKTTLSTSFINNSCSENFEGEDISIDIFDTDNNLIHSIEYNNVASIEPGESFYISEDIDANILGLSKELYIVVNTVKDNNEDNNLTYASYQKANLNSSVYYDFDNGGFDDFIAKGTYETGFDYKGESFFIAENYFSEAPCKNILDQYATLTLETCLDVSQFVFPQIEFDLIQFNNDITSDPNLLKNANSIEIKFIDNGQLVSSEILNNFIEGNKSTKTIQIPLGFKGKMEMNFYLAYGREFFAEVEEADIVLIDNFTIHDIVATEDVSNSDKYKIYPNPSNDCLNVEGSGEFEYEIFDINGRIVGKGLSTGQNKKLNLSYFSEGSYILRLNDLKNIQYFKFAKI